MPRFALLCADSGDLLAWEKSLGKKPSLSFDVINVLEYDWLTNCLESDYQLYLLQSPGVTNIIKQVYDERIQILTEELGKPVYPSLTEIRLHENKKYLAYWLSVHQVPHPPTYVLLSKQLALKFVSHAEYPIVYKQNIGSSGKGVRILESSPQAAQLVTQAFGRGIRPKLGPNFRIGSLLTKIRNAISKKGLLQKRMSYYRAVYREPQKFLIFQDYVPHQFEWRVVVIGDSYFAHKKVASGSKASGSLLKDYGDPPLKLLDFVRGICLRTELSSTSIDIFETDKGYLVNEIQTFFGQSDEFQMKVDGVPGRYRHLSGQWVFEPGDWASNQCYDLRLEHALFLLSQKVRAERT